MFYELTTKRTLDDVINSLQDLAPEAGFSILHQYDFFTVLEGKGFPIEAKVWTFELCRASMASKMLKQFPIFSTMMPCRISIYEDSDTIHIATMNMMPMIEMIKEDAELYQQARDLYKQLIELMGKLAIN
ncbi:MAG: hypothetical protein RL734_2010 [Bacteroidota bacterium]|jgi:uncharacterized protein (DUF302 family)